MSQIGAPLTVTLPGVLSWSRPRPTRGGVRYPAAYVRHRDAWGAVVLQAVRDRCWEPPPTARYRVEVTIYGGGKRDLDRVCTAVLDALQGGGAVRDDCLVDSLCAERVAAPPGRTPATTVEVTELPRSSGHRSGMQHRTRTALSEVGRDG